MSAEEINRFASILRLLRHGLVLEAMEMKEQRGILVGKNINEDSEEDEDSPETQIDRRNAKVKRLLDQASKTQRQGIEKTDVVNATRKEVVKELMSELLKYKRCARCKGISPGFRKDGAVKIFKTGLNQKDKAAMIQAGFKEGKPPQLILEERRRMQLKHQSNGIHADEGVADLNESSGEDMDIDTQIEDAANSLVAADAAVASGRKSTTSTEADKQTYISAAEVQAALQLLFEHEADILGLLYSPRSRARTNHTISADIFFVHLLLVPPNRFRPGARRGGVLEENPRHTLYKNILEECETLRQISREINDPASSDRRSPRNFQDLTNTWLRLQDGVNSLIDRDKNPVRGLAGKTNPEGIKQSLEKKEGMFRMNMMGKRVNFAARSVISPDPNIETNEIGVPPVFAMKLTYPEPVTSHNFYELKEAVVNGPDQWPGAAAIENESGLIINLRRKNAEERLALANQLLAPSNTDANGSRNKKVHRHLSNGDVVIMNRQPTLHKPSMMIHRARILPGEKTIRMHYANCNTYNADFDGDEMNMHFPQNESARSEALLIADTDHQYLSGTAGAPLRGLIQDHISICVGLTSRDTFFTREEYQQLLYSSLRPEDRHTTSGTIETIKPAILKPRALWTGKQVITTILKNIKPSTHPGLTFESKSQVARSFWGKGSEEDVVIFEDGDFLCGILDKKQIGNKQGFVSAVYETYGHTAAGRLLSVLGRLLTKMLHIRAFSCGVEDLILTEAGEEARRNELKDADHIGLRVASQYVSLADRAPSSNDPELRRRLENVLRNDAQQRGLDILTNARTKDLSTAITDACLPEKLMKPFPRNQMQTMTGSGAKGTNVNANLISCNLGQQVLEGRRVPIMISGKSLPCFKPFECSVRAGGYITDRFLTGIRPQEYFFHAMAGREGLIDTAVKTSRSGYLQRCVVKNMEGLKVEYDASVRDSDGSIVQFLYGEDGLDVTKQTYLTNFKFLANNFMSMFESLNIRDDYQKLKSDEALEWNKKAQRKYAKTQDLGVMDPATARYNPNRFCGSTSEVFFDAKNKVMQYPTIFLQTD
jgi:DNA-directed RNA polymerase beta' subunit